MNNKKKLRNKLRQAQRQALTRLPTVTSIEYTDICLEYEPDNDIFYLELSMVINKAHIVSLRGELLTEYLPGKDSRSCGVKILCPLADRTDTYNSKYTSYDLYLIKADSPRLYSYVRAWVDSVGDLLDIDKYDKNKNGKLYAKSLLKFKDSEIPEKLKWNHTYTE